MHDNPLNQPPNHPPPAAPPPNMQPPPPGMQPPPPGHQQNAYAPPSFDYQPVQTYENEDGGNYAVGFIVGFLFSFIGLIAVQIFGKHDTKRGSVHGFLLALAVGVLRCAFVLGTS